LVQIGVEIPIAPSRWARSNALGGSAVEVLMRGRCVAVLVLCGVVALGAQTLKATFEVASVKPASPPAPYSFRILPGRLAATSTPLIFYISRAYGIPQWRIVDEPKWAEEESFDISAKSTEPAAPTEILAMLRTLLEDRFQLRVQLESREVDADLLVLSDRNGGNGPGRHPVSVDCETKHLLDGSGPGLFPPESRLPCGGSLNSISFSPGTAPENIAADAARRPRTTKYSAITIERLADNLSSERGRPTLDRTGLSGQFDIQLDYVADTLSALSGAAGPSLEVALEEQLGPKLRRGRGRVEFLVIRSVQQPTEN
jgi:uncharacterized protein (TIGR03435 family)